MAGTIKTKAQLYVDSAALPTPITRAALITHLDNMVASYEDIVQEFTTAQRDALAGGDLYEARKIYNTTNDRMEFYNGATWIACSQKPTVAVDCSANPNYQEGSVGDQYIVSVAGKIGGASGKTVYVGDMVYCITKNAGGTEAAVGTSWAVCYSADATDVPTRYLQISLSSAEILDLNATPKEIVPAPGAGKIIIPIGLVTNYTFVTTPYATNVNMAYRNPTGGTVTVFNLSVGASQIIPSDAGGNVAVANEKLEMFVLTGNPTGGDGTATVGIYYKIHTL